MVQQKNTKRTQRQGFKKGNTAAKKNESDPIKDYLIAKLEDGFPVRIIERLSKGLRSQDSKIFLDIFKTITKHIQEPIAPVTTSPVVQALLDKYLADVSSDITLIEDRSTPEVREEEAKNKYRDQR